MADKNTSALSTLTSTTIATGDLFPVFDISTTDTKGITKANLDKSIATVDDATFEIADNADATKKIKFQASGITTGTTRTLTAPNASTTILGTDATQTVTNKTIDPSLNTIDGDVLDITFNPTNYTPTTTGATGASDVDDLTAHLKGIDNRFVSASNNSIMIPIGYSSVAVSLLGNYTVANLGIGGICCFNFASIGAITSAYVVLIANTTGTVQYDLFTSFNTTGESYLGSVAQTLNTTQSVTANNLYIASVTSLLSGQAAGDFCAVRISSDTATISPIGLVITYS